MRNYHNSPILKLDGGLRGWNLDGESGWIWQDLHKANQAKDGSWPLSLQMGSNALKLDPCLDLRGLIVVYKFGSISLQFACI